MQKLSCRRTVLDRCTQAESRGNEKKTFAISSTNGRVQSHIERTLRLNGYWVKGIL